MALSPEGRILRARMGAYALHSKHDPKVTTVTARTARWQRYLDRVDPGRQLGEGERARRAKAALRSDMIGLSLKSARARRRRRQR